MSSYVGWLLGAISTAEVLVVDADIRTDSFGKDTVYILGPYTNVPRECTWRSKDLDFVDQLGGEAMDNVKQINHIKLFYEDSYADLVMTLRVSVDGGVTWVDKQATIGTGDGTSKQYTFDYAPDDPVAGFMITLEVMCTQAAATFKWTGMEIDLTLRGTDFAI